MKQIIVTADKPGRAVEIHTQIDDERRLIALMIQPNLPADPWIWLAPAEARQVADALIAADDELESE
jgi:hypothetical protein